MRLDDIDKEKVIKFPGRSARDVSEERAKFSELIKVLTKLSAEKKERPERSQAILRSLKFDYSERMAAFVHLMLHLLELKGDEEQFLDLVMAKKWDKIRIEFLENKEVIIKKVRGILNSSESKARIAELGIRLVK